MTIMLIRDGSLHVKVFGHGYPLAILHAGPGEVLPAAVDDVICADPAPGTPNARPRHGFSSA